MSSNDRPNPIDALITAGRLFAATAAVLLPVILLLQALKAGILLGLIGALGEDIGATIGWLTSSALLSMVVGVAVLVTVDSHAGHPPRSPVALLGEALPFLLAFGLAGLVGAVLMARFALGYGLPANTAMLFGIGAAGLTPWLVSARRGETPGVTVKASFKHAAELAVLAFIPVAALLVFQQFSVELVPALADSAVGRKAPLDVWVPVESLISSFITPLVAMAIAGLFLDLDAAEAARPAPAPTPGPTFTLPGGAAIAAPGDPRLP